ncbi:hypothetical protein ACA910_008160 [Epithemia clementina (nom. ined.)]
MYKMMQPFYNYYMLATLVAMAALSPRPGAGFSTVSTRATTTFQRDRRIKITTTTSPFQPLNANRLRAPVTSIDRQRKADLSALRLRAMNSKDDEKTVDTSILSSPLDQALAEGNLRKAVLALKQSGLGNSGSEIAISNGESPNEVNGDDSSLSLSRSQWKLIFDLIEERTANAQENDSENLRALVAAEFPATSAARDEMTDMYQTLKERGHLTLFGAVQSQQPLAAGSSHNVPPTLLESILDLPMKALTPQPTNSLLIAGTFVALVEGILSLALGIPMTTLFLASLFLATCDRLFLNGATFESFLKIFSPGVQEKILRHEAGHFLAAYLLGCPVEGIVLSAWAALKDKRFGLRSQVSAGTSFFDPELSQQINTRQSVTKSAVDRYSIIVMAGIAAEADNYGRADGGAGDEMSLIAFLSQLNFGAAASNNKNQKKWDSESIRNQARWGALQAVLMLREYKPAYDALVDALERGGTLGDCIYAIEKAARKHNLKPMQHPLGYIEEQEGPFSTKEVVWKPYNEGEDVNGLREQYAAWKSLSNNNNSNNNGSSSRTTATTIPSATEPMDEETMAKTLQQYRSQVEAKLRDVEQRLGELEKQQ